MHPLIYLTSKTTVRTHLPSPLPPTQIKACPASSAIRRHRTEQYTSSHGAPRSHRYTSRIATVIPPRSPLLLPFFSPLRPTICTFFILRCGKLGRSDIGALATKSLRDCRASLPVDQDRCLTTFERFSVQSPPRMLLLEEGKSVRNRFCFRVISLSL